MLHLIEEHHSALVKTSENSLNEFAAAEYSLIVPLNLEHPPVLLYVNGRLSLLLTVLLSLTIYKYRVSQLIFVIFRVYFKEN